MKVAILHLSDLHMDSGNSDWLMKKIKLIVAAVWNDFFECEKIIIVVSGDISNTGTEVEFGYAKQFFRSLLKEFASRGLVNKELENKIICVPGNHDCNFNKNNAARTMLLSGMRATPTTVENSVFEIISVVQDEYRVFAKEVMIAKDFTLGINNNIPIKVGDKTILFRLYNTSWMSIKKEEQNSILIPMDLIDQEHYDADLVISVFHHHYDWITPGCDNN